MAFNFLSALKGLAGGGLSGAALGSSGGPLGAAIGGGLGALGGGLAGGFDKSGKEGGIQQAQTYTPQQQNILQFLQQQGHQGLQNPYQGFQPIAQQARNQFNQQTIPSLAERFASMGQNSLSSPTFASQLGQAGAGLEEALAALQSQYGMQGQQNALQQLALGLSPQFENYYQQSQPGFTENLFNGAGQAAPSFYQSYLLNKKLAQG
jgi:hypothetical protein